MLMTFACYGRLSPSRTRGEWRWWMLNTKSVQMKVIDCDDYLCFPNKKNTKWLNTLNFTKILERETMTHFLLNSISLLNNKKFVKI